MKRMLSKRSTILLFLFPAVLVFCFTVILPIIWSIVYSFFSWNGVTHMRFIGIDNFKKLISDIYFVNAFKNNIYYIVINLVGQIGIALILALMLTHITKGTNFFKTMYFAPTVLSGIAVSQVFQKFYSFDPPGIFNVILDAIGLGHTALPWLGTSQTALISVAIIECYKNMGLYLVIIYSGLIAIPKDVIESAKLDGAKGFQMFRFIKLPYIKSVMAMASIMAVNGLLKAFDIPFITTNGGPGSATELVTTYMYKTAFNSTQYGYGSAIAVFIVLESIIVVCILRKALSKSTTTD